MDIVGRSTGKTLDNTQLDCKYLMPRHPDRSEDMTVFVSDSIEFFFILQYALWTAKAKIVERSNSKFHFSKSCDVHM